ncbi:ROK family protein [Tsuneonella troitsensis]|uniref:ROK family protein n=1 Tax=Tsuneonella troitsensis TaxID=292222 RepID=UPI000B1FB9CB|nr:ROK family protein [Tsuneonella troitsensis]
MKSNLVGAIEAGGTKFVLALADEHGAIRARTQITTENPDRTFRAMIDFFRDSQSAHGPITAFGIGSFGPIALDRSDPLWGSITSTPKQGWTGASFPDALAAFDRPLAIETDVNAAALGEWIAGAGSGASSIAYTTIGTGIGTGILHDGKVLSGISHFEAGHVRTPRQQGDDFPGVCPFHGDCLEGLVSGPAIMARSGRPLDELGQVERAMVAAYVADFATTLVLLHMPERLIFGGGVCKTPGLLSDVRKATTERLAGYIALPALEEGLEGYIVAPQLGDDAGIHGAIELARRLIP